MKAAMNVVVPVETRYERTADGSVWTDAAQPYSFWQRYLAVFDGVKIVARVRDVLQPAPGSKRADGDGVAVIGLPFYLGPWQYALKARQIKAKARSTVAPDDAIILRVPGQISSCLHAMVCRQRRPYAVEVIGDPYDVFAPGSVRHVLRPFLRWWFTRRLRQQCRHACAAAYVTERTLQERYPSPEYSVGVSDVNISQESLASTARTQPPARPLRLVTVGSLEQLYKGTDVLIDAVANCLREGLNVQLVLLGDGRYRAQLQDRASAHGLNGHAVFRGHVPAGEAVRAELDSSDVFLLPSRTEGLPRALIEAMGRGLPCVASRVGGIVELLPAEDTVAPGDPGALARKIREVASDPERMRRMSARNLEKARAFDDAILRERRNAFYRHVRERTEAWLLAQSR